MKFVVLLALVGLASCRTALVGGDRARDVTIEYTYIDDLGKEVTVKVKADKLGLDLSKDDSTLSLKKVSSPSSSVSAARSRFAQVEREQEPTAHRFLQFHPQPAPAPAPLVETKFRTVSAEPAAPRPVAPRFQFVELDDFETPETRFVHVQAPRPTVDTRFVEVEIPRAEARTQFVQFEAPEPKVEQRFVKVEVPRPEIETRFVQVEAPRPKVETKFVRFEVPEQEFKTHFVQVQSPRQEALTHFVQAKPMHVPSFHVPRRSDAFAVSSALHRVSGTKIRQSSSDDNSAEK